MGFAFVEKAVAEKSNRDNSNPGIVGKKTEKGSGYYH